MDAHEHNMISTTRARIGTFKKINSGQENRIMEIVADDKLKDEKDVNIINANDEREEDKSRDISMLLQIELDKQEILDQKDKNWNKSFGNEKSNETKQ